MCGGGEGVGADAARLVRTVRVEEEGPQESLLDVEHQMGRRDRVEALGFGSVRHQAAREKSSGMEVAPR